MYAQATHFLADIDADWRRLIEHVGPCNYQPRPEREPYEALIRAVAYQQLHGRAAEAILNRLLDLNAGKMLTPNQLLAVEIEDLRACGFSARKIETLRTIAGAVQTGQVPSRKQALKLSDDDLIQRLVALKGIGRWTVEMLLMHTLERMDILPVDDFGVRDGYRRLKKLDQAPTPKRLWQIGTAWSPHRTIASWYLWRVPR